MINHSGFRTVKVPHPTYQKLCALVERIARDGWRGVGVSKDTPVTMWATVDAALDALAKNKKESK